jgi:hypothetical protein
MRDSGRAADKIYQGFDVHIATRVMMTPEIATFRIDPDAAARP